MKIKFYKLLTTCAVAASAFLMAEQSHAQGAKKRVLFIGNKMTESNLMPLMFKNVSLSAGDTAEVDFNAPFPFSLEDHASDGGTIGRIGLANWDYVVLQEQGQKGAFRDIDVATEVYPYAHVLDSIIRKRNNCATTVFFQTWGFRNGDLANCPSHPAVCTADGMDTLLEKHYREMALDNDGLIAPVGMVFKKIKDGMPAIDLFEPDGMNPSLAGSYAAAVTFYTIIFGRNPSFITVDLGVPPGQATFIRNTVTTHVFSGLAKFFVGTYTPDASFTSSVAGSTATFNSTASKYARNYSWDFGDGNTSVLPNPTHAYTSAGTFNVRLIVDDCNTRDTFKKDVVITSGGSIREQSVLNSVQIFPNPSSNLLNLKFDAAVNNVSVGISNVLGQSMIEIGQFDNNPINVESLPAGVYLLNLKDAESGESFTRRFVKD